MHIKTTMRYYFIPARMAIIKKIDNVLIVISTLTAGDFKFSITKNTVTKNATNLIYILFVVKPEDLIQCLFTFDLHTILRSMIFRFLAC